MERGGIVGLLTDSVVELLKCIGSVERVRYHDDFGPVECEVMVGFVCKITLSQRWAGVWEEAGERIITL